jgi:hypothetical protein
MNHRLKIGIGATGIAIALSWATMSAFNNK